MHPFAFNGTKHFDFFDGYQMLLKGKKAQTWRSGDFHSLKVVIGNDVWIGDHVAVLKSSMIGNGSVVAYRSLLTGDVPSYTVFGGAPARCISRRFPQFSDHDFIRIASDFDESGWWCVEPAQMPTKDASDPLVFLEAIRCLPKKFTPRKYVVWREAGVVYIRDPMD
jgi:hypothetical protein